MTVDQLAYLRCPDKIRANLINMGGPRLTIAEIERRLARLPTKVDGAHIGEPKDSDAINFQVGGLIARRRVMPTSLSKDDRAKIAALAKGIADKPEPPKERTFRYRAPRTNHASTAHAERLIDDVCKALGIPRKVLLGKGRMKFIVAARSLIVALLRERSPDVYSYPRIASILKRMDHSTMIYSHQQFGHYFDLFPVVAHLYAELRESGK